MADDTVMAVSLSLSAPHPPITFTFSDKRSNYTTMFIGFPDAAEVTECNVGSK